MSILSDVKKYLGIADDYTAFDRDVTMSINSVLRVLNQLGVGSSMSITEGTEDWDSFTSDEDLQAMIKPYVYMKVRKIFDPPTSTVLASSMDALTREWEWRIAAMTSSLDEGTSLSEGNW